MAKLADLLGTKPNQIPTNADLGRLAFVDSLDANTIVNLSGPISAAFGQGTNLSNLPTIKPSLMLDFVNRKKLDPRITFTRGANTVTYFDSDKLLKYAANNEPRFDHDPVTGESLGLLIEESRTNLFNYTGNLEKWNKVRSNVSSNIVAPDGTITAYKLLADTTVDADHWISNGVTTGTSSSTVYTISYYVKPAEIYRFTLDICDSSDYITTRLRGVFNLSTLTANIAVGTGSCTLTAVGDTGWYRATVTGAAKAGSSAAVEGILTLMNSSGALGFTGDNTSGMYIWGPQLEAGAFATTYIPSKDTFTSRATTGTYIGSNGYLTTAAINTARYNYTSTNLSISPKLLLESAANNLVAYSETVSSWNVWKLNPVANNVVISPDGAQTADKIIENSTLDAHNISQTVTVTAGKVYTFSCYVKAAERTRALLCTYISNGGFNMEQISVDLITGDVSIPSTSGVTIPLAYSVTPLINGWFRCSITAMAKASVLTAWYVGLSTGVETYQGDGTSGIYVWGAQFEEGYTATAYIPNYTGGTMARAADVSSSVGALRASDNAVMTGSNFYSWYRQDEGSVFCKFNKISPSISSWEGIIQFSQSNYFQSHYIDFDYNSGSALRVVSFANQAATVVNNMGSYTQNTYTSISYCYKTNDFASCRDGGSILTDTAATVPLVYQLLFGLNSLGSNSNIHISKFSYYPKRLTNTELQTLSAVG
jgi:hypothetical protein